LKNLGIFGGHFPDLRVADQTQLEQKKYLSLGKNFGQDPSQIEPNGCISPMLKKILFCGKINLSEK